MENKVTFLPHQKKFLESSKKEGEFVNKDIAPHWVSLIDKLDKNRTEFSKIRDNFLTYIKREDRDKFEIALNNMYAWHQKNQNHISDTYLQKQIYNILKYLEKQKNQDIECTKNGFINTPKSHTGDNLQTYRYDLISYTYENDSISIEIYMSRSINDEIAFNFHVYQPVSNIDNFKSMLAYFATKEENSAIIPFVINKITYKND